MGSREPISGTARDRAGTPRRGVAASVLAALALCLAACGRETPVGGTGERESVLGGDVLGPVRVGGSPYEMGWRQGRLLAGEIRDRLARALDPSLAASLTAYAAQMRPLLPVTLEQELQGIAAGAEVSSDALFLREVAREGERWHDEAAPTLGAALALPAGRPETLLAAYEGLDRVPGGGRWVWILREPTDGTPTVGLSWPGGLGLVAGCSKAGVAAAESEVGGVPEERRSLRGVPFAIGLRAALERARDAKDLLERLPRLVGNRVAVCDRAGARYLALLHLAAEPPSPLASGGFAAADGSTGDPAGLSVSKDGGWEAVLSARSPGGRGPAVRFALGERLEWEVRPAGGAPVARPFGPP